MDMDIKFTHKKQKLLGKSLRAFADRQSAIQKFISREENLKLRGGKSGEVLFREILIKKLGEINGYEYNGKRYKFSQSSILKAVDELAGVSLNEGLMVANEKITNLLLLGTSIEENLEDGTRRSFIDFENLQNNDFYVTEEFEVSRANQGEAQKHRRPDLVLFINGIPIVVIELKKSSVSLENGIKQLQKEQGKDEIAHLFKYIQLTIAANGSEARYGTTGTPFKFYSVWKEQNGINESLKGAIKDRKISVLDATLFALLSKDRLLRLIRHYILFDKKSKKVCRYQQLFAIEETLKRVSTLEDGARMGGLIWHTQGSSKSLTMVMLTKLLKQIYPNSKIIVVTDRIDLDEQIQGTFKNTDIKAGRASSGSDLIEKLQSGVSMITTLVHKFEIDLLIVVDKLLTGFDAPRASTLYIDKQLKEHNLLQAIARLNRLYDGKDYGYIIDYRGLLGELDEALTSCASLSGFDPEDLTGAVIDVRSEIVKAKTYYAHLDGLFSDVKFKDDLESYVAVLEDVQKRDDFKEWLSQFARAFKLALSSEKICDILSGEEIKAYKQKVKFYNELRKAVQLRYHEACDFGKYEAQMQKLLDAYVSAKEVNELTKLVNIFETEFDDEVQRVEGKNARADTIISAVSAVVKEKMESNSAFYKSIAKQIQDVIDEYKAKRLSEEEKLAKAKQLKGLITGALKPNEDRYPKEFNSKKILFAIYDNLLDILGDVGLMDVEVVARNLSVKFYEIYEKASKKPEWHKNKDVENEITSQMEDALWEIEDEYGVSIDEKEKIYQTIRGIEISFYVK